MPHVLLALSHTFTEHAQFYRASTRLLLSRQPLNLSDGLLPEKWQEVEPESYYSVLNCIDPIG